MGVVRLGWRVCRRMSLWKELFHEMFLDLEHTGTKIGERDAGGGWDFGGRDGGRGRGGEGRSFDVGSELEAGVLMMNAL